MKTYFLIGICLLTVGCENVQKFLNPSHGAGAASGYSAKKTYILMGQSNMNGRADISAQYPDNSNVHMLYSTTGRLGPGWPFGVDESNKGTDVTLIQCAVDGTRIESWMPGGVNYQHCMTLVPINTKIDGVLFYQGENDTGGLYDTGPAVPWAQDFTITVRALQLRFNNVPIVFAQIGITAPAPLSDTRFPVGWVPPYLQYIKDQQESIALPGVAMIKTDDQPVADQGWHHGDEANEIIGGRFFDAMQRLTI